MGVLAGIDSAFAANPPSSQSDPKLDAKPAAKPAEKAANKASTKPATKLATKQTTKQTTKPPRAKHANPPAAGSVSGRHAPASSSKARSGAAIPAPSSGQPPSQPPSQPPGPAIAPALPAADVPIAPSTPIAPSAPTQSPAAAPAPALLRAAKSQLPPLPSDDAVVNARNAFVANDINRLNAAAAAVESTHPLRVHVDAWRLRLQLNDSRSDSRSDLRNDARFDADASVRVFLDRFAGTLAADGLRRDWVLSLARRGLWPEFEQQLQRLPARGSDDPQPGCADARHRAITGDPIALAAAREALPLGRELGEACLALLEQLAGQGVLSQADIWRRLLAAVDGGALNAVRKFAALLPHFDEGRALSAALDQPQAEVLVAPNANFRELVVIALARQARNEPLQAAERLMRYGPRLGDEDRAWVWAQVAASGARRLHPDAAQWAQRGAIVAGAGVPLGTVSDETLGWLVRAGLRNRDWKLVRGAIERMTEAGRADPAWRYWWAKSVLAEGRTEEANQQMRAIAGPWNFYGLLAAEELGMVQTLPLRPPPSTEEEITEVLSQNGVIRALKFSDLALRTESVKEMAFTIRTLTDRHI